MGLSRKQVDRWPVMEAGLARRVARALQAAGIPTIGELRDRAGARIPRCGASAARNIAWFFEQADSAASHPANLRTWLGGCLKPAEQFVIEQRYGLDDPLFRPQMKRRTLAEIAEARGGQTRERARQVLRRAQEKLRSRLARALAETLLVAVRQSLGKSGGVVTSAELGAWRDAAWLGGCQPWGALLLLAETGDEVTRRHDYFSMLPASALEKLETRLLVVLEKADVPVAVPERLASVVLDRHPNVDATRDGRFFLFPGGAKLLLAGLASLPAEEAARRYNEQVVVHSRREASELARVT